MASYACPVIVPRGQICLKDSLKLIYRWIQVHHFHKFCPGNEGCTLYTYDTKVLSNQLYIGKSSRPHINKTDKRCIFITLMSHWPWTMRQNKARHMPSCMVRFCTISYRFKHLYRIGSWPSMFKNRSKMHTFRWKWGFSEEHFREFSDSL